MPSVYLCTNALCLTLYVVVTPRNREEPNILSTMPVAQLKALARSDVLSFAPRFPVSSWPTFLRNEPVGSEPLEQRARRLRMFLGKPGIKPC